MRVGSLVALPNEYSNYGRLVDQAGVAYTVEAGDIPDGASLGDEVHYRVEIWGDDSGLAYQLEK